ncbi:MAG: hypothetical protein ACNI3C_09625 [Candidatus Marinarcus sp.]|uniref:hypothetical protein n=1 Tax=Candidatus Marinarcus sp. TaxID=3100987 RepID=UPI003AFFE93D
MQKCLITICQEFEAIDDFLHQQTKEKEAIVNRLFIEFMECFSSIKEEKLQYPSEFVNDVRLYNEGFALVHEKFKDVQIRYLMLSDFYDFARLTKKYQK